jgi:hypothetical protein
MTADQLKRLAEVLPKEMGAEFYFYKEEGHLELTDPYGLIGADDDDYENARATIALLDAMEKAGVGEAFKAHEVVLSWDRQRDCYCCQVWLVPNSDTPVMLNEGLAPTRWEAVAQAALSVFGGEKE